MYARETTSEETYTLLEAKRIIKAEQAQEREVLFEKAKYILLALLSIAVAIVVVLMQEDAFISIIMLITSTYFFKEAKRIERILHK